MDLLVQDSLVTASTQSIQGSPATVAGGVWAPYVTASDEVLPVNMSSVWQTTPSGMRIAASGYAGGIAQPSIRMGSDDAVVTFTAVEPTRSMAYPWSSGVVFMPLNFDTPTIPGGADHDFYAGHRITVGGTGSSLYVVVHNAGAYNELATITHVSGGVRDVEATISGGVCTVRVDGVLRGSPVVLSGGISDLYFATIQSNSAEPVADSSPWLKNIALYGTEWVDPTAFWTNRRNTTETI